MFKKRKNETKCVQALEIILLKFIARLILKIFAILDKMQVIVNLTETSENPSKRGL